MSAKPRISGSAVELSNALRELQMYANTSSQDTITRGRMAAVISGGYDYSDTLHNIYLDFGYPLELSFFNYWNMYRRFGIARNIVELPADTGWRSAPIVEGGGQFNSELEKLVNKTDMWNRLRGLDVRQRVGRYAGMFMRVKDGKAPHEPLDGTLSGVNSLVQMIPMYEGQLTVNDTDNDPMSDNFGLPTMYEFSSSNVGGRDEKRGTSFNIHPSRIIIAAEGADNGNIYGISALEAPYNSLMDLRKIIGAGGEGFYKNAAQSIVFNLQDASSAKQNGALLDAFNDQFDDFTRNRSRRSMWTPGMEAKTLDSSLTNPKEFFMNALYDVAAASKMAATIIIGKQEGRAAAGEDQVHFLSTIKSRQDNFQSKLVRDTVDWSIKYGILPASEYEIEWDDLLAASDDQKLGNVSKMATVNREQFLSGGDIVFSGEEMREAAGYEPEDELPPGSEDIDEDEDEVIIDE